MLVSHAEIVKQARMAVAVRTRRPKTAGEPTREKLARAALAEFNAHGFDGTDTNKIARRAGFAPQTFYRWFADKTEIFLFVYRRWEEEEGALIAELRKKRTPAAEMADAIVAHHRATLRFRRSLRQRSVESDEVRAARAQSRRRQIARILEWNPKSTSTPEALAPILLQSERLCDALAEGEFKDMGVDEEAARHELATLLKRLR